MSDALGMARTLRATLKSTVSDLEHAAAAPAGAPTWRQEMSARLHDVRTALIAHVEEVEGQGGLLERITADAPHLEPQVERVRHEHGELLEDVDQVLDAVDPGHGADAEAMRAAVLELMTMIARHRQHGADVVYEAWGVDVGEEGSQA